MVEGEGQVNIEPKPIRRLEESLVNRIAAGEIIHRPASALKELLENCLDAGSKQIKVTVKDGGLKLLQIQDDGCGIRKGDLPILCERFTTSKLSKFSDLTSIATYGFRGEALASISHVAHLSVVTKTKDDPCAWRVVYADGAPIPPKAGLNADVKPCAGNDGTLITVEDLFYNTPTRLSALRSASDEYARILDVITRYAIHNPTVSFSCKKAGLSAPDISTPSSSNTAAVIRLLYGPTIARELVHIPITHSKKRKRNDAADEDVDMDANVDEESRMFEGTPSWEADTYVTSANHHAKKMIFLLFINHRLVESTRLKRAVEAVYNTILPKGTFPFVYLSLNIDPASVDVNVHPTKREVHFLSEDEITEAIMDKIQVGLAGQGQSRTFEYQTLLTGGAAKDSPQLRDRGPKLRQVELAQSSSSSSSSPSSSKPKTYPQHKVRGSTQFDRTLDSMFPAVNPSDVIDTDTSIAMVISDDSEDEVSRSDLKGKGKAKEAQAQPPPKAKVLARRRVRESECFLQSVIDLRAAITSNKHHGLSEVLESHTFVGIIDMDRSISLIQHSTKLFVVNHAAISEELFYQLGVRQFGDFGKIHLEPQPSIKTLIQLAVACETGIQENGLSPDAVVEGIVSILMDQREMLEEYFSLVINEDGKLHSLPLLLPNYTPNLDRLPLFLMRLGPQVDWTSEKECFESFLREVAFFYSPGPVIPDLDPTSTPSSIAADANDGGEEDQQRDREADKSERWQIEHVVFPAVRDYMVTPKTMLDNSVVQVASLPDLYRVFERC